MLWYNIKNAFLVLIIIIVGCTIFLSIRVGISSYREYKYKPIFQKYLAERYSEDMNVSEIYFNSKSGEEEAYTYLKNDSKINFYTFAKKDNVTNKYTFRDNYFLVLWQNEVKNEVEEYSKKYYNNIHLVKFGIIGEQLKLSDSETMYVFNYDDYIPKSKVPTYNEVKDKPKLTSCEKELEILINENFKDNNSNIEYENIFSIIKFINEKGYNVSRLNITYGSGTKSETSSSFTYQKSFYFNKGQLDKIKSPEDIRNIK